MQFFKIILVSLLFLACGCASDSESDGDTLLRVVNAAPDAAAVDVYLEEDLFIENRPYLVDADYDRLRSGSRLLRVTVANSFTNLVNGTSFFDNDTDYTLVVMGRVNDSVGVLLQDDNSSPNSDRARLRLFNAISASSADVDVYITEPGAPLSGRLPNVEDLNPRDSSPYLESLAGTYQIRVTPRDSLDIVVDSGPLVLREGQVRTFIIADRLGAGAPYQLLALRDRR
jgi:hypothetical protein